MKKRFKKMVAGVAAFCMLCSGILGVNAFVWTPDSEGAAASVVNNFDDGTSVYIKRWESDNSKIPPMVEGVFGRTEGDKSLELVSNGVGYRVIGHNSKDNGLYLQQFTGNPKDSSAGFAVRNRFSFAIADGNCETFTVRAEYKLHEYEKDTTIDRIVMTNTSGMLKVENNELFVFNKDTGIQIETGKFYTVDLIAKEKKLYLYLNGEPVALGTGTDMAMAFGDENGSAPSFWTGDVGNCNKYKIIAQYMPYYEVKAKAGTDSAVVYLDDVYCGPVAEDVSVYVNDITFRPNAPVYIAFDGRICMNGSTETDLTKYLAMPMGTTLRIAGSTAILTHADGTKHFIYDALTDGKMTYHFDDGKSPVKKKYRGDDIIPKLVDAQWGRETGDKSAEITDGNKPGTNGKNEPTQYVALDTLKDTKLPIGAAGIRTRISLAADDYTDTVINVSPKFTGKTKDKENWFVLPSGYIRIVNGELYITSIDTGVRLDAQKFYDIETVVKNKKMSAYLNGVLLFADRSFGDPEKTDNPNFYMGTGAYIQSGYEFINQGVPEINANKTSVYNGTSEGFVNVYVDDFSMGPIADGEQVYPGVTFTNGAVCDGKTGTIYLNGTQKDDLTSHVEKRDGQTFQVNGNRAAVVNPDGTRYFYDVKEGYVFTSGEKRNFTLPAGNYECTADTKDGDMLLIVASYDGQNFKAVDILKRVTGTDKTFALPAALSVTDKRVFLWNAESLSPYGGDIVLVKK